MTPETFVGVAEVLVAIVAFLWFFSGPWRGFLTDVSRHHYFTLRDRLFLMAAEGRIDFSNAAYLSLRRRLNAHIRFAHIDTMELFIAVAMHGPSRHRSPEMQRLSDSIDVLEDTAVKGDLQEIFRTIKNVQINQMLASSPLLCLLVGVMALVSLPFTLVLKPNWISWMSALRDRTEQITRDSVAIADTNSRYQWHTGTAC